MIAYVVLDERGMPLKEALYQSKWEATLRKARYDRQDLGKAKVVECTVLLPAVQDKKRMGEE